MPLAAVADTTPSRARIPIFRLRLPRVSMAKAPAVVAAEGKRLYRYGRRKSI